MKTFRLYMLATVLAAAVATLAAFAWPIFLFILSVGVVFLTVGAVFLVALAHAFFLGLPIALIMQSLGHAKWWALALAGFIVGTIPIALAALFTDLPAELEIEGAAGLAPLMGLCGALGGLVFWLVVRQAPQPEAPAPNKYNKETGE